MEVMESGAIRRVARKVLSVGRLDKSSSSSSCRTSEKRWATSNCDDFFRCWIRFAPKRLRGEFGMFCKMDFARDDRGELFLSCFFR